MVERLNIDITGTFTDEITSRAQNALDTLVEFGATELQVMEGLFKLEGAGEAGARGMAQMANTLRTLADESENIDAALSNVGKALDIAADRMIKAEDAGRELGKMLRGDVTLLTQFGGSAAKAAEHLNKITDPAQRAALGMSILNNRMASGPPLVDRFQNRLAGMNAKLAASGLGFITVERAAGVLGGAVVAATAALAKFVSGGLDKAIERSATAKKAFGGLTGAMDKFQEGVGRAIIGQTRMIAITKDLGEILKMATGAGDAASAAVDLFGRAIKGVMAMVPFGPLGVIASQFIGISGAVADATSWVKTFYKTLKMGDGDPDTAGDAGKRAGGRAQEQADFNARMDKMIAGDEAARTASAERSERNMKAYQEKFSKRPRSKGGGGSKGGGKDGPQGGDIIEQMKADSADRMSLERYIGKQEEANLKLERWVELREKEQRLFSVTADMSVFEEAQARAARITDQARESILAMNGALVDLANDGIAMGVDAFGGLVEAMSAGELSAKKFGLSLMTSMGDLLVNFGKGLFLMAVGVQAIETGILSPAAAIGIAVGAIAVGSAMKGFAKRAESPSGGGGASSAAVGGGLERFARELTDKTADREGRTVVLNIDGREARGVLESIVGDGLSRGRIPVGNYLQSAGRAT